MPPRFTPLLVLAFGALVSFGASVAAEPVRAPQPAHARHAPNPHSHAPHRAQVGKASVYAKKFAGRKMADGQRMDPNDDNAASKTLPLGSKAVVTNLDTGKSAVVTIQDRGPYVPGRIVDLSPATAGKIGLTKREGVAPVEVKPLDTPADPALAQE